MHSNIQNLSHGKLTMIQSNLTLIFACVGMVSLMLFNHSSHAAPTTYRAVDVKPDRIANNRYGHLTKQRNNPYNRYPQPYPHDYPQPYPNNYPYGYPDNYGNRYPNNRAQVYIGTPNVQVYLQPQTQYHYQSSEEVYLPYGGTYRKTTEYLPQTQYAYPVNRYPQYPNTRRYGKVIQQGNFQD